MPFDPEQHHRHSIRVPGYDYTVGMYFVTMCTQGRQCLFGEIIGGAMDLSPAGRIVHAYWQSIPKRFPHVVPDAFVIMPNHLHGVLWFRERGEPLAARSVQLGDVRRANVSPLHDGADRTANVSPLHDYDDRTANVSPLHGMPAGALAGSLGAIVQGFKSSTTIRINRVNRTPGRTVWQRNYYEHIIRSEKSLNAIRRYIEVNPTGWLHDPEYANQ